MNRQKGFSLIELLVVCAILIILASFLLPSIIASIQTGNETAAVNTLQQVVNANVAYMQLYPSWVYATAASKFGGVVGATACPNMPDVGGSNSCLIPNAQALRLDSGTLSGYTFSYRAGSASAPNLSWSLTATPTSSLSGRKSYCVDNSGVIEYSFGVTALTITANNSCPAPSATVLILGQ